MRDACVLLDIPFAPDPEVWGALASKPRRCGCGDDITEQCPACERCGACAMGCCLCAEGADVPAWRAPAM